MALKVSAKPWPFPKRNTFALAVRSESVKKYPLVPWPNVVAPQIRKSLGLRHETWIAERLRYAATVLRDSIDIDPEKRGSVPVVRGTRVAVATILAELAEDATLSGIADDLDLDFTVLRKILQGIAIHLDRPFLR
jgi:uncharacterized protein (DUF433 family)